MTSLRLIDATIHELSAPQALEQLLRHFRSSTKEPVTLMTRRGQGKDFTNRIRAELSRSRNDYRAAGLPALQFGFRADKQMSIVSDGVTKECWSLVYRITPLQQMKNLAAATTTEALLADAGFYNVER